MAAHTMFELLKTTLTAHTNIHMYIPYMMTIQADIHMIYVNTTST